MDRYQYLGLSQAKGDILLHSRWGTWRSIKRFGGNPVPHFCNPDMERNSWDSLSNLAAPRAPRLQDRIIRFVLRATCYLHAFPKGLLSTQQPSCPTLRLQRSAEVVTVVFGNWLRLQFLNPTSSFWIRHPVPESWVSESSGVSESDFFPAEVTRERERNDTLKSWGYYGCLGK